MKKYISALFAVLLRMCSIIGIESGVIACRRLGGPPRLAAGRLSAAGRKAGNKVGTLHAIPRR